MKLSVILITKNEVKNIRACLESVSFADEIIVVDSGSTDSTADVASAHGAQVLVTDWPGFGPQKNRALDRASGDWILSIDADERVTPKLRREILETLESTTCSAFYLPRLTNFCGTWIHHSGWYPDYHIRLFRRDRARFSPDLVHESVVVSGGEIGHFKTPLIHYSFRKQEDFLRKMVQYAVLGAEQARAKGRRSSIFKAISFAAVDFVRMYIWRRGFLDGSAGLTIAILSAEAMFQKYLGLALLESPQTDGDPAPPARFAE